MYYSQLCTSTKPRNSPGLSLMRHVTTRLSSKLLNSWGSPKTAFVVADVLILIKKAPKIHSWKQVKCSKGVIFPRKRRRLSDTSDNSSNSLLHENSIFFCCRSRQKRSNKLWFVMRFLCHPFIKCFLLHLSLKLPNKTNNKACDFTFIVKTGAISVPIFTKTYKCLKNCTKFNV